MALTVPLTHPLYQERMRPVTTESTKNLANDLSRKSVRYMRMHPVLDLRGSIPDSIYITNSRYHDSNFLDEYEPYKWAIYTMDKAYVDFEALYTWTRKDVYFVTRPKSTMRYEAIEVNYNINELAGIIGDEIIRLTGYKSSKLYPDNLRLVKYYDAENDEVISFITNSFDLGPLEVANIYRNRWQIETFFKWIKGNLTIKALWDTLRMQLKPNYGSQSTAISCLLG